MKRNLGCFRHPVVIGISLAVLLALVLGALIWFRLQQDQARAESTPPQVLVINPAPGKTIPAGMAETVSSTIFGGKPIVRAELWMDGNLKSSDSSSSPGGDSTLYANFDLLVPNGPHQILVRGIDTAGSIGQSLPVNIIGGPKPDKVFLSVPVNPGETLANLARTYSTDPATLANLNPSLGSNEPTAGTRVIVPANQGPPPVSTDMAPAGQPPSNTPVTMPDAPPLQSADTSLLTFDSLMLAALHRPAAPTNLQGQMENCNIKLRWNDNTDNEERYDVWMTGSAGTPRVIASLKPGKGGTVWAELTAPEAGNLSIWVEAVNAIGGQPSNIISLSVESKCAPPPTKLQIEALEISASGGYDRTYCYVSLQGTPEIRIPVERKKFIRVKEGSTPSADAPLKKIVTPIPANGLLDISGECWGWSGKNLDLLGNFSHQFTSDTWNGKPQELSGANFTIALVFSKQGDSDGSRVIYDLPEDSHIPAPYDVKVDSFRGAGQVDPRLRALHWKWNSNGDSKIKITSFGIYQYGYLIQQRTLSPSEQANPPIDWEQDISLDHDCQTPWEDPRTRWQVVAQTADGVSPMSLPFDYKQEACEQFVRVVFGSVYVPCSGKNTHGHFNLIVNGEVRSFWDGNVYTWIDCGKNTFADMIGNWSSRTMPQAFVIPLDLKKDPNSYMDVRAAIWNDSEDLIGRMKQKYQIGDADSAQSAGFKCGKDFVVSGDVIDNRYATFYINITVYPNPCDIHPPQY